MNPAFWRRATLAWVATLGVLLLVAWADEPSSQLTAGVDLELFVSVKGGLADEKGTLARVQVSAPDVAEVTVVDARNLRVLGKKEGTCDIVLRGFDRKTHRFHVTVLSTAERAKDEFGRQRIDMGLGHMLVLPLPPGYYRKGGYPPLVSGSNHEVVDYEFLGAEVILSGRKEGIADVSFLGSDGKHTLYRVWIKPLGEKVGVANKQRLDLVVGASHELDLPAGFDPQRDKVLLATAGRAVAEGTPEGKLKVTAKAAGTCDLAIVYRSKPTVYRFVIAPETK